MAIQGDQKVEVVQALVDTGASVSLVTADFCRKLSVVPAELDGNRMLRMVDGTELRSEGGLHARVKIGDRLVETAFQVVRDLPAEVMLGVDFAVQVGLVLDFSTGFFCTR